MTIIALLASISLVMFIQARTNAIIKTEHANIQDLYYAFELYREFSGNLPPGTDSCSACGYNPLTALTNSRWDTVADSLVTNGYLLTAPYDDEWGRPYAYDNNFRFVAWGVWSGLCSVGPDGIRQSDTSPANDTEAVSVGDDICVFFPDGD